MECQPRADDCMRRHLQGLANYLAAWKGLSYVVPNVRVNRPGGAQRPRVRAGHIARQCDI